MAVSKISYNDYMKRIGNMTAAERQAYTKRVGEWLTGGGRDLLAARAEDSQSALQNVILASTAWDDDTCRAWNEGTRLLTALVGQADTWLPDMLFAKSAKRCIRVMERGLVGVMDQAAALKAAIDRQPAIVEHLLKNGITCTFNMCKDGLVEHYNTEKATEHRHPDKNSGGSDHPALTGTPPTQEGNVSVQDASQALDVKGIPMRPRHIDQYVRLLPQKTQERAATVKDLLRDLDLARENARRLMEAGEDGDRPAAWMKKATQIDDKVRAIYRELDTEWAKLVEQGRVGVDDFGNAYIVDDNGETTTNNGEPIADSGEAVGDSQDTAMPADRKKRLDALRRFLRETRIAKDRDKHIQKWKAFYDELVSDFGTEYVTETICANAATLGITLGSEKLKVKSEK